MINVDCSKVDNDKLECSKFIEMRDGIQELFVNHDFVESFCVHEAAHVFYYQRAGIKIHSIVGPSIVYTSTQTEPYFMAAQVRVDQRQIDERPFSEALVDEIARVHASGKVASLELTKCSVGGEKLDCANFNTFCTPFSISETERIRIWQKAEEYVRKDLQIESVKSKVWKDARELEKVLFESS
jgi:hypothetical protein